MERRLHRLRPLRNRRNERPFVLIGIGARMHPSAPECGRLGRNPPSDHP